MVEAHELAWFKSSYSGSSGGDCVEVAQSWVKSSHSGPEGGDCLEVAMPWFKSSHSGSDGGDCIEVAACARTVHVRDSKSVQGPILSVPPEQWAAFVAYAADRIR